MGCGASQSTVAAAGAAVTAPEGRQASTLGVSLDGRSMTKNTNPILTQEGNARKLALLLAEDPVFWQDEGFHDLMTGKPPHDARVIELLLDDAAEGRMRKAAVAVYCEGAAAEWGDDILEPAFGLPSLGAVTGLMASIMGKVEKQQANRHNCKMLQETVRSAALMLCSVLRRIGAAELQQQNKHLKAKLVELCKVLLAIRALLGNYSHKHGWVLMLPNARLDKTRFEALHYYLEMTLQNIIGVLSQHTWTAPLCDYSAAMERLAAKLVEVTGRKLVQDAIMLLASQPEACNIIGGFLKLDGGYVQEAFNSAGPVWATSSIARRESQLNEKKLLNEKRTAEAQAQFEKLRAAASAPRFHSHKTKAEKEAAEAAAREQAAKDAEEAAQAAEAAAAASTKDMGAGQQGTGAEVVQQSANSKTVQRSGASAVSGASGKLVPVPTIDAAAIPADAGTDSQLGTPEGKKKSSKKKKKKKNKSGVEAGADVGNGENRAAHVGKSASIRMIPSAEAPPSATAFGGSFSPVKKDGAHLPAIAGAKAVGADEGEEDVASPGEPKKKKKGIKRTGFKGADEEARNPGEADGVSMATKPRSTLPPI